MKRKIISLLLCLVMALSLIPTVAFGATADTVDHIDINTQLAASVTIDGKVHNETISFSWADVEAGNLTITAKKGSEPVTVPSYKNGGEGGDKTQSQVRLSGEFLIGTENNPVVYTLTLQKNITIDGVSLPVTLVVEVNYWSSLNICPGRGSSKGIDVGVFDTKSTTGSLTIQKTVSGLTLDTDKTFTFTVTNTENQTSQNVDVTVKAGQSSALVSLMLPYGSYTVEENANSANIEDYKLTVPAEQSATLSANSKTATLNFTNTYEKNAPETTSVTVTKEWVDDNNSFNTRPEAVTVQLLKDGEETEYTLTLNTANNWQGSFNIPAAGGNYTVSEEPVPGYTSQVIVPGEPVVTVGALEKVPNCNFKTFNTKGANLVIAKLTENDGYVVWTKTPLTNDQKDTLLVQVKAACNIPDNKTVDFISGENVTHTSNGETATFADGTLSFTKTKMWSMFWYGNVNVLSNNGFTIVNTLNITEEELVPATLTIKKVDSNDNTKPLSGATFTLTNADGRLVGGKALVTDENGTCTFTDLPEGYYTLAETKAPDGYKQTNQTWTIVVVKDEEPSIVLNEDKTAFQKVYDCTVSNLVGNESVPLTNGLTITNEKEPEFYTVTLPIQKIVDKKVGSDNPGETKFTFVATKYDEQTEKTTQYGLGTITTKGVGTYNGTLKIEVPANLFTDGNDSILLQVSEVKGTDSKWSYDKTVYRVLIYVQDSEVKYIVNPQIALRATADQEQKPTTLTFTNVYNYKYTPTPRPTTPAKPVTSVKTGDMGVALYAGLAILSMTGSAGVILRRRKNDK